MLDTLTRTTQIPAAPIVVPGSICFTMDKNRTWATSFGLPPMEGHTMGRQVAEDIAQACFHAGSRDVIFWALSESNRNKRSREEKEHLKKLIMDAMKARRDKREEDRTAFYLCGDWNAFNDPELDFLAAEAYKENAKYQTRRVTVLFGYRGITDFKRAAAKVCERMGAEAVENEDMVREHMWIKHLRGNVDMFVRTGVTPRNKHNSDSLLPLHGENAFVWDVPQYWPDFTVADLYESFRAYGECHRPKGE